MYAFAGTADTQRTDSDGQTTEYTGRVDIALPLQPTPAATATVSPTEQPGQSWLHFKLDRDAIMHVLNAALAQHSGQSASHARQLVL